jgi:two-component system, LytTR family, response regulator
MAKLYKAILVDDEESSRNILSHLLGKHCPQIEILLCCEDLEQAVVSINKLKPDLIFLDIEMPNYAGYEIVSFFEKLDFEIIFVTAYNDFAVKAFEMSAVDYLLKPIDIERLIQAVKKFEDKQGAKDLEINYKVLQESLTEEAVSKIVISIPSGQKVLEVKDIVAIEANQAYSHIHTIDGNKYMFSKNLKHFELLFEENKHFIRTHKSWMVNTKYVLNYSKSRLLIQLENNIEAKLSKYRKDIFKQAIVS